MAEELGFKVKIDGVEKEISSLKELKLATKQAADEQLKAALKFGESSKQYEAASKKVSALKDKMDDLGDYTRLLKGSGIERSTQGFNQLGEGLRNLDFDKVKVGLTAVKSALAATGVMLLVQGVTYLIENFDRLSQGTGLLAKALQFVGSIISNLGETLKAVSDAFLGTSYAFEASIERITEATKKAAESTNSYYEGQMKLAQAAGKSTIDIERKKLLAIQESTFQQIVLLEALKKKTGELGEEQQKQLDDLKKAYSTNLIDRKALELKDDKEQKDKAVKAAADFKAAQAKELEEFKAQEAKISELKLAGAAIDKENRKLINDEINAEKQAQLLKEKAIIDQRLAQEQEAYDKSVLAAKKAADEKIQSDKAIEDAKVQGLNAGAALADLVGTIALNRAKGNANKEIQIRKQMFAVDKAFNVARAVQDGIRSVQAALTIPPPGGQILAGINAGAAAINVGKILATKFDGGSVSVDTGSTGGGSVPSIGGNINTTVPQVQQPGQRSTQFDENGRNITVTTEVVETQSRKVTERIDKFNEQRAF